MFDRVKSLFQFLHTMFGVKMTSSWDPSVLPPVSEPVVTYMQRLAAMKKGDGITQLKKWRVTCVRAYKVKSTSRHEYISATVVDSENKSSFVAFDRHRGDPEPVPLSGANPDPNIDRSPLGLPSPSNSSLSSSSSVPDSTRHADDRIASISPPGTWNKTDQLIYELNFEKPFFLYELAILAVIVHEENTSYLLMSNNCYHYAGTIMKVLEEQYDTVNTADGAAAGKWCGLVLYPGGNTSSLLEKFREGIKNFVSFPC